MVCAATTACRVSPRWSRVFKRVALRSGGRAAKVAVARRLLQVVFYMLKRNQPYDENYEQRRRVAQGA